MSGRGRIAIAWRLLHVRAWRQALPGRLKLADWEIGVLMKNKQSTRG